jgi:putative YjhG/YagF family dehydratase
MGWKPEKMDRHPYLILSTHGGLRAADDSVIALGYHTGHWELDLLVKEAAVTIQAGQGIPFAAYCTDPCDGRSQGTTAMMDSLPYRNDAAIVLKRLIRSLPSRRGILGIGTCDKGLPAMMQAFAGCGSLPGVIIPGGVTLPVRGIEDLGTVQTLGARFSNREITLDYASEMACKSCGSSGGGCHFLGTAASSQVVAEALGLALPYSALSPSGEPFWIDLARRSAQALLRLADQSLTLDRILTQEALNNAMLVHAAFGGSTNLLLHLPAIAHAAGLEVPTVNDWIQVNQRTPRLVDALPNGPENYPTIMVFMAGGVPEVMLKLAENGILKTGDPTAAGVLLAEVLERWKESEIRKTAHRKLRQIAGIDPGEVIFSPAAARRAGLSSTVIFPRGNLAPQGSVVKATTIEESLLDRDGIYRYKGPAKVFTSEKEAIQAIKNLSSRKFHPGEILVLIGSGPSGTGMEEIYQITSALKSVSWGKGIPVITDARFSGVSTGPCIGHVGPEALAGGPIGKLRDGDLLEIEIDRNRLQGRISFIGRDSATPLNESEATDQLRQRAMHPKLRPHPDIPDETRLWAALQNASGGTWRGSVYDIDTIIRLLEAGIKAEAGRPD